MHFQFQFFIEWIILLSLFFLINLFHSFSDQIIQENHLTALMVTHNMRDAIAHGNRLIMMSEGKIIYDVSGEEKKNLQVADLLRKFEEAGSSDAVNDRLVLS